MSTSEFGEALRALANIAGVTLPERRDPEVEDQSRRLFTILERAQTYYEGLLRGSTGGRARAYLEARGLNDETLRTFGMGYAPSGNGLLRYLEGDGFSEQELQAAGRYRHRRRRASVRLLPRAGPLSNS